MISHRSAEDVGKNTGGHSFGPWSAFVVLCVYADA
jgi:hypothetical protein